MTFDEIKTASRPLCPFAVAGLLALAVTACTGDTPGHCTSDQDCQDGTLEGHDPARPHCHGEGNFCYEGCAANKDCTDKTRYWYEPGKPYCDPGKKDCVAQITADLGLDARDAAPDQKPEAGPDGSADAGDLALDLTDALVPDQGAPPGTPCGTDGVVCASGLCVDGVCCDKLCPGVCESCKVSGSTGTCTAHTKDTDPENGCPGTKECGNDVCDGQGKCEAASPGSTVCNSGCKSGSPHTLQQYTCDGTVGQCLTTATDKLCQPYSCAVTSGKAACTTACVSHSDCHPDSLCDRSGAHLTGKGICVATSSIVTVGATEEISDALVKISSSKPYLKVLPRASGNFTKALSLTENVKIIGTGASGKPVILDPSNNGPAITMAAGVTATLQGLTVQGATGTTGVGLYCNGSIAQKAVLTVVESTITGNTAQGVLSSYCDVTLRRNTIQGNSGGGADLSKGTFVIVNNVVVKNGEIGATGSDLGGFNFGSSSSVTSSNNTVAENKAKTTKAAGIICSGGENIVNSILWGNIGSSAQHLGCTFTYSDVQGGAPTGTGNLNLDPKFDSTYKLQSGSPCINKGTSTGVSKIDIMGGDRLKGTGVDMGAHEN